jgi:prolyl-tRNA editing enzyme YbaK/EbsC (Cys-tRNA(Pro) deacylase)
MRETVQRVVAALAEAGVQTEVQEFAAGTRTAEDAANALGTTVGQIVKSLVFLAGDRPVLVLVSGANRADTAKLQALADAEITRATADDVRRITGYAIGGVPPFAHLTFLTTYLDRDLLQYESVWAAAGTPNAVFAITPHDLLRITAAQVADVAEAVH